MSMTDAETVAVGSPPAAGVLVITVDRLPAWILPAYGATWVAAPTLDRLAGSGITFDRLIATATDPRQVVADLAGGTKGLFATVASLGGHAAVVTDDPEVAPAPESVERIVVAPQACTASAEDAAGTNLGRLFAAATEVVRDARHRLVWVHAGGLGRAWDAPDAYRDAYVDAEDPPPVRGPEVPDLVVGSDTDPDLLVGYRQAYAAQLTLLDEQIEPLVRGVCSADHDAAERPGWAVMVAGVRGMPLGLHGRLGTGASAPYGELVHLPAVIVHQRRAMAAQRYGGLTIPADLGLTLAGLCGGGGPQPRPAWHGRSLAGLFTDWSTDHRDRVIVAAAEGTTVVTPHWQFVLSRQLDRDGRRKGELFAKPDDFFELCDVADRCPAVAEELRGLAEAAEAGDADRAWCSRLEAAAAPSA